MDGSPNDRSEMVSVLAKWANHPDQEELWNARPVRGDMGMLVVPESQIQCYLLEGIPSTITTQLPVPTRDSSLTTYRLIS